MTTTLFGYTILTNQEYDEQQALLLDLKDTVKYIADLEVDRCRELDALRTALEYHNEEFKNAVSDSSFYREQYARALRVIEFQGHLVDQATQQLSDVEDEYLHG